MAEYTPNPSDDSRPLDSDKAKVAAAELRALKHRINELAAAAGLPVVPATNQSGLTQLLYPSADGGWRDVYRAGWRPAFFNQQWGGAQWGAELKDGATGNVHKFDVATGYITDNTNAIGISIAADNAQTYQGFKVPETGNYSAIWLKLYKVGNPTNSLAVFIVADDGTGKPLNTTPITNGTANTQSGRLHTSKADGEWYRFVFPTPVALTGGTQYHILIKSTGAVDVNNSWNLKGDATKTYPFGNRGYGTAASVWTVQANTCADFLVENANSFFQIGTGLFDSSFKFFEGSGSQINQSKALIQPLKNFFDGKKFTALHRVTSPVSGKPIADYLYGLDHDRITLGVEAGTGFAQIKIYDSAGTVTTVTGTTVVTTGGPKDIAIHARTYGDGADYAQLWVNGVKEAEVTLQTFTMDANFRDLGHCWLGGGFAAAPTWTQKLDMTTLPSANGWTWAGTAAEANAMSVSGGKLRQNRSGYASTDTGYYSRAAALNNANGWAFLAKVRILNNTNTAVTGNGIAAILLIRDGARDINICLQEFFSAAISGPSVDFIVQNDFKSAENVVLVCGKGSDYYVYYNGRLILDGTNKLSLASSTNSLYFGDLSSIAGENADAVWDYVSYYNTAILTPQIASGMILHEYAHWSGDKTSLLPTLWNAGVPYSVKQICGVEENLQEVVEEIQYRRGVTGSSSTTVSTGYALVPEMEMFALGSSFEVDCSATVQNTNSGSAVLLTAALDGAVVYPDNAMVSQSAGVPSCVSISPVIDSTLGLHKIESKWGVSAGTTGQVSGFRKHLRAKSKFTK